MPGFHSRRNDNTFCCPAASSYKWCLLQILEGDELNAVDGVLVKGLKPSEVSMLIRGPVGSAVEIEVIP